MDLIKTSVDLPSTLPVDALFRVVVGGRFSKYIKNSFREGELIRPIYGKIKYHNDSHGYHGSAMFRSLDPVTMQPLRIQTLALNDIKRITGEEAEQMRKDVEKYMKEFRYHEDQNLKPYEERHYFRLLVDGCDSIHGNCFEVGDILQPTGGELIHYSQKDYYVAVRYVGHFTCVSGSQRRETQFMALGELEDLGTPREYEASLSNG